MLVTFTCKAYADITMFGDVAKSLLHMMGHSGSVPGAILAEDIPAAIQHLQQSLAEQTEQPGQGDSNQGEDEDEPVSLNHRALPLLELLKAAARQQCDVMWDKT